MIRQIRSKCYRQMSDQANKVEVIRQIGRNTKMDNWLIALTFYFADHLSFYREISDQANKVEVIRQTGRNTKRACSYP